MKTKSAPARSRKPTNPDRPDRPDPGGPSSPPGREYQDPWFPDLSVHLYGSNWDFEIRQNDSGNVLALKAQVRDALKTALGSVLSTFLPAATAPDIQFAFDDRYPGAGTTFCLSIGVWLTRLTNPSDPDALAARRNGLLRMRKSGQRAGRGEMTLRFSLIDDFLRRMLVNLPGSLPAGAPPISINAAAITVSAPSSIHIAVFITTTVPVAGALNHLVEMMINFGSRAGDLTIGGSNLNVSGSFLIGKVDASALIPFIMPRLGQLGPRTTFMGDLKLSLTYATPVFETRGQGQFISGQQALVVPVSWDIAPRAPSVRISGPRVVNLTGSQKMVRYHANTTDMINPVFTWKLDGRVQAGANGSSTSITYNAGTQAPGTTKIRRVEVIAMESAPPNVQKASSMTTAVKVVKLDL